MFEEKDLDFQEEEQQQQQEQQDQEKDVEEKIQLLMSDIDELIFQQNKRQIPYYSYQAEKYLNLDESNLEDAKSFTLIVYTINTDLAIPFIQFLFCKDQDAKLTFIEFKKKYNVMSQALEMMQEISKTFFNISFDYKGYTRIEDTSFLFFELPPIDCHILFSINDLCFMLVDEILNETKTIFPINQKVRSFFRENVELCLLVDEQENCFEIPCVVFAGYRKKKLEFYATFGNPPTSFSSNQYLFKDYDGACEDAYNAALTNGDYNYGGIVRFAILTGKTEYINQNEITDLEQQHHDVETLIINRGDDKIHILLKHYEQQYPLTLHYINNNNNIL